jgi:hypothetical protein
MTRFFRTVIGVEVLSENAPISDNCSLAEVAYLISEGDCSGAVSITSTDELSGPEAAEALVAQGSDPEFFGLSETGCSLSD